MKNLIYLYLLSFTIISLGQDNVSLDYYFSQQDITTLNKDIPSPESVIGHPVGKWHITHDKLVEYMRKLAFVSERITPTPGTSIVTLIGILQELVYLYLVAAPVPIFFTAILAF